MESLRHPESSFVGHGVKAFRRHARKAADPDQSQSIHRFPATKQASPRARNTTVQPTRSAPPVLLPTARRVPASVNRAPTTGKNHHFIRVSKVPSWAARLVVL